MIMGKVVRFCLFFITSSICSLKGYFCFFLQHSSGRCVRSTVNPFLSKGSVKFWYLEITNQCTDPASQFRFQDDGVLNHVSSTGCIVPLSGKVDPKPGTTLVVFDDQNSCANKTVGQTYTQTVQGSLRHSSGKCIQPHTSFQTVPSIGAKLEYTTTCNATKQQFILGSVTCDGERTKDVNCPSSQVIMVTSANYGGLGRLKTCGYNLNYNCLLPASLCHVKRQCDGQQSCEINVGTSEFKHDPCPGTSKYLHLEYKCVSKTDFTKESIHVTSVRLASEVFPGQGYVEVLADSKPDVWQRLCIKNWKDPEQQAICRSLGYSGAKQRSASATTGHGLAGNRHVIHSDMYCSRNEKNVSSCCFGKLAGNEEDTCPMMAYVSCSICSEPMLSGKNRADFTFTASNSIPGYTADQATASSNRSWCGVRLADYLEIDLGRRHVISQLSTLGDRSSRHRITSYEFLFSKDKNDWFEGIAGGQKLLTGNLDNSKKLSTTILDSLATARYIKILPKSWSGQPCMRLEICGHRLLPDAPRNITLSRLSAFTASVSWIKPTDNGDGKFTDFLVRLFNERKMEYSNTSKAGHVHFSTLKPYTQYTVTVQAGNKHGYGSKVEIIFRTNSSVPSGPPTNIKIVPESATSLGISWNPPLLPHRNGILDGYELCFAHVQSDEDYDRLIRTKSTTLRVSNLEIAMEYKVKISARNDAGFGNYSADYFQITNAEAPSCNLSTITKETFVINLQEPKREVRFCQVIVMALASQESFQKALLYSDKLFTYLEASGSSTPLPYVAAEFSASDFAEYKEFTVGDGSIFSALPGLARNNGAVKKYFNGPLSSQTRYTVIQRFHSNKELLYSSDFLPPVETKGHGSFEKLKAPKGSPTNIKIVAKGSISFKISWSQPQPSHRTAIIDGYNVCIAHVQSDQDCDQIIQTKSTTIRVGVLEAATKYKVKVSARREAMFGEYSVDHFQMTKAASPTCDLSTIAEESFTIYLQAPRREVSFCQVIVIALSPNVSFSNTGYHQTYQEAIMSAKPSSYIAAEFNVWEFFSYKQFTVGDGKNSTALVRMPDDIRLIKVYHNGPLFSDTTYTVFQKFYSDKELLYSSDFLPLVRTRGKSSFDKLKAESSCSSDNLKVPFVVVTVLLVIILVTVVCLLLFRRQRRQNQNSQRSPTTEGDIAMNQTQNNDQQTAV